MLLSHSFKRCSIFALSALTSALFLSACDFMGGANDKRWQLVEVDSRFYEEERTVGIGLRRVLSVMAPVKNVVLEAISDKTSPELLPEKSKVMAQQNLTSAMGLNISRRVPLEYGELNFFSTRPNRGRDLHILEERPEIKMTKDYKAELEPDAAFITAPAPEAIEIIEPLEKVIEEVKVTPQMNIVPVELKKADFLFNEFAKLGK